MSDSLKSIPAYGLLTWLFTGNIICNIIRVMDGSN